MLLLNEFCFEFFSYWMSNWFYRCCITWYVANLNFIILVISYWPRMRDSQGRIYMTKRESWGRNLVLVPISLISLVSPNNCVTFICNTVKGNCKYIHFSECFLIFTKSKITNQQEQTVFNELHPQINTFQQDSRGPIPGDMQGWPRHLFSPVGFLLPSRCVAWDKKLEQWRGLYFN